MACGARIPNGFSVHAICTAPNAGRLSTVMQTVTGRFLVQPKLLRPRRALRGARFIIRPPLWQKMSNDVRPRVERKCGRIRGAGMRSERANDELFRRG